MANENVAAQVTQHNHGGVEQNVIADIPSENTLATNTTPTDDQSKDPTPSPRPTPTDNQQKSGDPSPSTRTPSRLSPPGTINMSGLRTTLPDIALNSPSTNIIGTPFAHTTTNTPFEYPFPETTPDSASPAPPHRPGSPHFHPPHTVFHPPPAPDVAPPSSNTTFSLIHPKFKAAPPSSPPPIPPSLKKKRWSLNFLSRRRTSNPPTPGESPSSPPGSPPAVTSGAILGGLGSGRPRLGDRSSSGGGIRATEDSRKSVDT